MNKLSQSNYKRFNTLFHKGEQIVVGFREDYTHGYITKIDESGFGLFQWGKPKEYWYDWEHFEFASHPGFRFKKLPNIGEEWIDKVNIFTVNLLNQFQFPEPESDIMRSMVWTDHVTESKLPIQYQFHNSEDIIACVNRFNLVKSDFADFVAESPWGKITIKINNCDVDLKTRQQFVQTIPNQGDFDIIKIYFFDDDELDFTNLSMTNHKQVRDNEELDIFRMTQIGKPIRTYVSSGDPWFTDEPVEKVGYNVWKSKDGYAMTHAGAKLLEVICD